MLRGRAYATPARLERFHNGIKPTSLLHGRQALCHRAVPPPLKTRWCSQLFCLYLYDGAENGTHSLLHARHACYSVLCPEKSYFDFSFVPICNLGRPGTRYVDQTGLKFNGSPFLCLYIPALVKAHKQSQSHTSGRPLVNLAFALTPGGGPAPSGNGNKSKALPETEGGPSAIFAYPQCTAHG